MACSKTIEDEQVRQGQRGAHTPLSQNYFPFFPTESATVDLWLPVGGDQDRQGDTFPLTRVSVEGQIFQMDFTTAWLLGRGFADNGIPILLAPSFRFLLRVVDWVNMLIKHEQFVPTAVVQHSKLAAVWRPADSPHIRKDMARLAQSMPLSVMAGDPDLRDADVSLDELRKKTLEEIAHTLVDSGVRSYGTKHSFRRSKPVEIGRLWQNALAANPPYMIEAQEDELVRFSDGLADWTKPWIAGHRNHYRLVIRFEPLDERRFENGLSTALGWYLSFWLQDAQETSTLIPADRVIEATSPSGEALKAILVRDLRIVKRCLRTLYTAISPYDIPDVELIGDDVFEFIEQVVPRLEHEGIVVQVPNFGKPRPKVRISINISESGNGRFSLAQLLDFTWRVAIDDIELDAKDFEEMVEAKSTVVRLGTQWVRFDLTHMAMILEQWRTRQRTGLRLSDLVVELDDGSSDDQSAGDVVLQQMPPGLNDYMGLLRGELGWERLSVPSSIEATLRDYQVNGFSWLEFLRGLGLGGLLADDMGLGKTLQVIAALQQRVSSGQSEGSALVVCPTSVVENWCRELARFAPQLTYLMHHGSDRFQADRFVQAATQVDVVVTSYRVALRDVAFLRKVGWDTLVVDEAQFIKNPHSKQRAAVTSIHAFQRIALTGTPVENSLDDLWSVMDLVNPGYLGSLRQFRINYSAPVKRNDKKTLHTLGTLIRPFILRRTKSDPAIIPELPDKTEERVWCSLTPEQTALYEATVKHVMERIEIEKGLKRRGLIFRLLTQLKQICNHPAHFLKETTAEPHRSGKMKKLIALTQSILDRGERALVFTQYTQMGHLIQNELTKLTEQPVLFFHGGLTRGHRENLLELFQSGGAPLMVLSLRAGGIGLNLTRATHVIHFDRWWNPAVESQATDRAYRIGQTSAVQVYKMICSGTLEDRIDQLMTEKSVLADQVIETGEAWLAQLDTAALRRVVGLSGVVND